MGGVGLTSVLPYVVSVPLLPSVVVLVWLLSQLSKQLRDSRLETATAEKKADEERALRQKVEDEMRSQNAAIQMELHRSRLEIEALKAQVARLNHLLGGAT